MRDLYGFYYRFCNGLCYGIKACHQVRYNDDHRGLYGGFYGL